MVATISRPKFVLGQVVATPNALAAFTANAQTPISFINRHVRGDWGDVDAHDRDANELALVDGSRIFSVYHLKDGTKFWIITEAVDDDGRRQSTCVLLPEDY